MLRRRSFQIIENPLIGRPVGSFGISEGNTNTREEKKKNSQNSHFTTVASGKVAQRLASDTSEQGLGREAPAA